MIVRGYSFATISCGQLLLAVKNVRLMIETLRDKYPRLQVQPMFSLQGCQALLTTDINMILRHLPEMACNEELKHTLLLYYRDRALINIRDSRSPEIARLNRNIDILEKQLWFKEITRIDLNLSKSSAGLISQLLCDPLVDKSLSYCHKPGFARVSLGILAALAV